MKVIDHISKPMHFTEGIPIFINKVAERSVEHKHTHGFLEIAYVESGEGIHYIDGEEFNVTAGDLFVINHHVEHEFKPLDEAVPLILYNCTFLPEFIDYSLSGSEDFSDITYHFLFHSIVTSKQRKNNIFLKNVDKQIFEPLFEKMYLEYSERNLGYLEILRAYVIELLVSVFRHYQDEYIKSNDNHFEVDNAFQMEIFDDIIVFINENYMKKIKLDELSNMYFFSKNHFGKLFKSQTGMTVSKYIQKKRVQEACKLLRTTHKTVLSIALGVGYSDIKFFNEIFKRHLGMTPSLYRKSHNT